MSTVDTSSWNPDADLNVEIEGIPLNADASIQQTWQVIRILMAAFKGDTSAIQALMVPFSGATASADGVGGFVPAPEAGDEDKVLKGDGTWGNASTPNLGTASRAVQTDANGALAVSSVTAAELGCLSGVTSAVQTQLDAKAADSGVVHLAGMETVSGSKTFSANVFFNGEILRGTSDSNTIIRGGSAFANGAALVLCGNANSLAGYFRLFARTSSSTATSMEGRPDGTLTWGGQNIQVGSDERIKTPISTVPDAVLDAWGDVQWGQFQYLEAVAEKGESARLHLGLIAQRVKSAFEAHGLDACKYGILCHEERPATADEPAVDLWMVRYAEAQAMEAAYQRRRADRLEARIAALEETMR